MAAKPEVVFVPTESRCLNAVVKHVGTVHNLSEPQRPLVSTANGVRRKFTAAFKSAISSGVMGHCGRSRGGRQWREDAASFFVFSSFLKPQFNVLTIKHPGPFLSK